MGYIPILIATALASALGLMAIGFFIFGEILLIDPTRRTYMTVTGILAVLIITGMQPFTVDGLPGWLYPAMLSVSLVTLAGMSRIYGRAPEPKPKSLDGTCS